MVKLNETTNFLVFMAAQTEPSGWENNTKKVAASAFSRLSLFTRNFNRKNFRKSKHSRTFLVSAQAGAVQRRYYRIHKWHQRESRMYFMQWYLLKNELLHFSISAKGTNIDNVLQPDKLFPNLTGVWKCGYNLAEKVHIKCHCIHSDKQIPTLHAC